MLEHHGFLRVSIQKQVEIIVRAYQLLWESGSRFERFGVRTEEYALRLGHTIDLLSLFLLESRFSNFLFQNLGTPRGVNAIKRHVGQMLIWQRIQHRQCILRNILSRLTVQLFHICYELTLLDLIVKVGLLSK